MLDPKDLFAFLATHDRYPISGQSLANEARKADAAPELVEFFEAIPVTVENESEIVEHAMKPNELPYGRRLDLGSGSENAPAPLSEDQTTLQIADIVEMPNESGAQSR
jgi:hypothetical protein